MVFRSIILVYGFPERNLSFGSVVILFGSLGAYLIFFVYTMYIFFFLQQLSSILIANLLGKINFSDDVAFFY